MKMTRHKGGYVTKKNGRAILGTAYGCTLEEVIAMATRVSDVGDDVKIYVEMILDGLDVIDSGNPDHVELKLIHTVGGDEGSTPIETREQALTLALKLAIQAPTDQKAAECVSIAERLAAGMHLEQVERCKMVAMSDVGNVGASA
tara:strand:- start:39 stop:473 length:435 start_codon:yes stop_codon:yes gene_type:complete